MANTFITVSPVETLNRGRIYFNQSSETLLTNFSSATEPVATDVKINGVSSLVDGMFYYSTNSIPRIKSYSNNVFTRRGVGTTSVITYETAVQLTANGYFNAGELITIDNNSYIYTASVSNTLVQVGVYNDLKPEVNNVLHLNSVNYANYVRTDQDDSVDSTIRMSNTSFLFLSDLAVRANSNSYTTIGYLNYNDNLVLASTTSQIFANNSGFVNTKRAYYQFNEVTSGTGNLNLDCNKSTFFTIELTGNTNLSFSNSQTGTAIGILVNNYGDYYINWPSNVRWPNGRVPTLIPSGSSAIYSILPMPSQWYGVVKFGTYDY